MKKLIGIISVSLILSSWCKADSIKEAKDLALQKNWNDSLQMVERLESQGVHTPDLWLLKGTLLNRFERVEEAEGAFQKYLSSAPESQQKTAVSGRIREIASRAELVRQTRFKWKQRSHSQALGFFVGYSPSFKPRVSESLGSEISSNFDVGMRITQDMDIGVSLARGVAKQARFKPSKSSAYQTETNVKHNVASGFGQLNFALNEPFEGFGPVVAYIPLRFSMDYTEAIAGSRVASTLGFGLATGLGAKIYTGSALSFDVAGIYHLSMPLNKLNSGSNEDPIQNAAGEEVDSSMSGAEVRISLVYLLGM